jgi:hypothetical protein
MGERAYVEVPGPWAAVVDMTATAPARYYASLVDHALRYGMPARRFGRVGAALAAYGIGGQRAARVLGLLPRTTRPDLEGLRVALASEWQRLAERSSRLSAAPPDLTLLALRRSSATIVFAFAMDAPDPVPLVVLKRPVRDHDGVRAEVRALERAVPAGIAPRYLGPLRSAEVQEGLPGAPLAVERIPVDAAAGSAPTAELRQLWRALSTLAERTSVPEPADELVGSMTRAAGHPEIGRVARQRIHRAATALAGLEASVLRHGDASPHNVLCADGAFSGLVDWESARWRGVPGLDTLNSAMAYFEHGMGRVEWSGRLAAAAFRAAWDRAPLFAEARAAAREAARSAEMTDVQLDNLEVAFFARRLARRIEGVWTASGPSSVAAMLEHVCAA